MHYSIQFTTLRKILDLVNGLTQTIEFLIILIIQQIFQYHEQIFFERNECL